MNPTPRLLLFSPEYMTLELFSGSVGIEVMKSPVSGQNFSEIPIRSMSSSIIS